MARDCINLMRVLGYESFAVAGHDRGSYVAFRLALDHPQALTHLVVMDSIPIGDVLQRCDARFALAWFHWFFLGQTEKPAERLISANPEAWYTATSEHMGEEAFADYRRAILDPETVRGMCEDYRAGLTVDREHDEADRAAGKKVDCPTLLLWSERDDLLELFGDPRSIWRAWADDLQADSIDCGHHMAEEAPAELAEKLRRFLSQ
jgi:haloacetate dehalogenase